MLLLTSYTLSSSKIFTKTSTVEDGIVLTVKRFVNSLTLAFRVQQTSWTTFKTVQVDNSEDAL